MCGVHILVSSLQCLVSHVFNVLSTSYSAVCSKKGLNVHSLLEASHIWFSMHNNTLCLKVMTLVPVKSTVFFSLDYFTAAAALCIFHASEIDIEQFCYMPQHFHNDLQHSPNSSWREVDLKTRDTAYSLQSALKIPLKKDIMNF